MGLRDASASKNFVFLPSDNMFEDDDGGDNQ